MTAHQVEPDGYCPFCRTVPCTQRADRPAAAGSVPGDITQQLTRIEVLLRRVARAAGVTIEGDET